jgi:hypothetical protein
MDLCDWFPRCTTCTVSAQCTCTYCTLVSCEIEKCKICLDSLLLHFTCSAKPRSARAQCTEPTLQPRADLTAEAAETPKQLCRRRRERNAARGYPRLGRGGLLSTPHALFSKAQHGAAGAPANDHAKYTRGWAASSKHGST